MNTTRTPLTLPDVPLTPLSATRLEAMISHALTFPQTGRGSAQVVPFVKPWAFATGMAALAASLLLAITLSPLPTTGFTEAESTGITVTDDLPTLLLYTTLSS